MRSSYLILLGLLLVTGMFALWMKNHPAAIESGEIEWNSEFVLGNSGDTVLTIDAFTDTIEVSAEARFGSSEGFTGVALSPDGRWIACTITGGVHEFGWLYDLSTDTRHPVAFQYGGTVHFHSWSPDGRFAAFVQESPAPIATIKLIDRQRIGDVVSTTGYTIQLDAEKKLDPPYSYNIDRWKGSHTLCFSLAGSDYCMDAETRTIVG